MSSRKSWVTLMLKVFLLAINEEQNEGEKETYKQDSCNAIDGKTIFVCLSRISSEKSPPSIGTSVKLHS